MKKTAQQLTLFASAMIALAVFFVPVESQASTGPIFSHNFNGFPSGWNQIGSFGHLQGVSGAQCLGGAGDCAYYNDGPLLKASWLTGSTVTDPSFQIWVRRDGADATIRICNSGSSCNSGGTEIQFTTGAPNDDTWHQLKVETRHFTGTNWYRLKMTGNDYGNGAGEWGDWVDTGRTVTSFDSLGLLYQASSGNEFYFDLTGPLPFEVGGGATRILSQDTPTPGSVEPDTSVLVEWSFLNTGLDSPLYTKAGVEVVNDTIGLTYSTADIEQDIVSSGTINFSQEIVILDTGDAFRWRPYLRTASSTKFLRGEWYSFSVVEQNPVASPFTPIPGGFFTTTSANFCDENVPYDDSSIITATVSYIPNGLCRAVAFLVIPSDASMAQFSAIGTLAQTKAPISWAVEVREVYSSYTATSSEAFPSLALDLSTSTVGNFLGDEPIELFSKEKMELYLSPSLLALFRALVATTFWLLALSFIYRQISSIWHKQVT